MLLSWVGLSISNWKLDVTDKIYECNDGARNDQIDDVELQKNWKNIVL